MTYASCLYILDHAVYTLLTRTCAGVAHGVGDLQLDVSEFVEVRGAPPVLVFDPGLAGDALDLSQVDAVGDTNGHDLNAGLSGLVCLRDHLVGVYIGLAVCQHLQARLSDVHVLQ